MRRESAGARRCMSEGEICARGRTMFVILHETGSQSSEERWRSRGLRRFQIVDLKSTRNLPGGTDLHGDTNALEVVFGQKIASALASLENTGEHSAACLVAAVPRCVLLAADPFGRLEYSDRSVRSRSGGKQRCGRL